MRVLVVGGGSIGRRHAANLGRRGGVVWVCDSDHRTRHEAASIPGVTGVFATLEEALTERPWDLGLVATPTHLHVAHAGALLPTCAAVFVEKPLGADLAGTAELCARAAELGRATMVGCNMRFHPSLRRLRELLLEGFVGRPVYARLRFGQYLPDWRPGRDYRETYSARAAEGGGIVLDDIHELDLALHLLGPARGFCARGGRLGDLALDVEDVAAVTLTTESGAVAQLTMDYLHPLYQRQAEVVGTRGALRWDEADDALWGCRRGDAGWTALLRPEGFDYNDLYRDEMDHLLECLAAGRPPMNGFEEARRTLSLALAVRDEVRGPGD